MQVNISNKLLSLIFSFQVWKLFEIYLILIYPRLILFHDKNTFMLNRHFFIFTQMPSHLLKIVFRNVIERSSLPEMFCEKGALWNFAKFTGKHLCQSLFFNKVAGQACNFIKKETLAQVFSCEFCKISKNIFSHRTPPAAASLLMNFSNVQNIHFTFNYLNSIRYRS